MPDNTNAKRVLRRALSMVEVVVSTLFVGLVLAASMQTLATVANTRARTTQLQDGPSLARDLLSEILQTAYEDPEDPGSQLGVVFRENSGNRLDFDDVDDFNGWIESAATTPSGTDLGIGVGWKREVEVYFVDAVTLTRSANDTGLKRITVTATPTEGVPRVIEALRSSRGAIQRSPHAGRTIVSGARVSIKMADGMTAESTTVLTKNHGVDD